MQIIQLFDVPPVGGAATAISQISSYLGNRHQITDIRLSDKPHQNQHGIARILTDLDTILIEPIREFILAQKINSQHPDVVLVHHSRFVHAPYILQFLKVPSVYFCQEPPRVYYEPELAIREKLPLFNSIYENNLRRLFKQLDYDNARAATVTVVNSNFSARNISKIYKQKVKVVGVGIDPQIFKPLKFKKQNIIIAVGNAEPQKNYSLALETLSRIPFQIRPTLHIVGFRHPEMNNLLKLAKKIKLRKSDFVFHTNIKTPDLVKLYNRSLLALATAHHEPLGLFPLEAMSCELPVVAIDEGGFSETVIDKKTGYLTAKDPIALATACTRLLKSTTLRSKLGKSARNHVIANYSSPIALEKLEKVLSHAAKK